MSQNVTHIIHKDRHGHVREDRPFSVPLTSEEGESEALAMSQKAVTEIATELRNAIGGEGGSSLQDQIDGLQGQIDAIIADKATVSLTASPTIAYVGEQAAITLTAKVTGATPESITIKKGSTILAADTNKSQLTATDTITPSANVAYSAEAVINGQAKTANATVSAVGKIYYGAGATEAAATTEAPKRTSPAGTYNVAVPTTGDYVFFVVPGNMGVSSATMGGFPFPLDDPATTTRDGATYKAYRSANPLEAGTYEITIK